MTQSKQGTVRCQK